MRSDFGTFWHGRPVTGLEHCIAQPPPSHDCAGVGDASYANCPTGSTTRQRP